MIRLAALAAPLVAAMAFAPAPALADAAAQVRALVAEVSGRPVRQVRAQGAAAGAAVPVRAAAVLDLVATGDAAPMVRRLTVAPQDLAPSVSRRPVARPANLVLRFGRCADRAVCARPLAEAAPLRFTAALPSAAARQSFVVTDGRVRHLSFTR